MSDTAESRRGKERSPNFPFIALDPAVQRAQVIYSHERRSSAPISAIARHWGYSESSSGFKQTLGAVKSYGLLVEEAGPSGKMVRLSDLALRILLDVRPDSPERDEHLKKAALRPPVASEVFMRWPEGLPSDHTLTHFLIFERGFSEDTANRAAKILRQNQVYLDEPLADDVDIENDFPATMSSPVLAPSLEGIVTQSSTGLTYHPPVTAPSHARSEKFIDPNGLDVEIAFSGEPTQETYEFLSDYIELRLKQFKRKSARASDDQPSDET
ncbi:Uncharacterised protein [Burkholderia cepacia]|uniref:Uncharacterized protein n=1 Tax=Burkholderia cepacia TaxID=292 RepID=A0AAE8NJV8_BURCE|nr:hypothetical protein [Burkholderia cepacia]POM21877.1 hypothetical protein CSX04_03328 [Burkholderia cepacia]SQA57461.1 Uncharacterised protein [Burkholderia cepacia]